MEVISYICLKGMKKKDFYVKKSIDMEVQQEKEILVYYIFVCRLSFNYVNIYEYQNYFNIVIFELSLNLGIRKFCYNISGIG